MCLGCSSEKEVRAARAYFAKQVLGLEGIAAPANIKASEPDGTGPSYKNTSRSPLGYISAESAYPM